MRTFPAKISLIGVVEAAAAEGEAVSISFFKSAIVFWSSISTMKADSFEHFILTDTVGILQWFCLFLFVVCVDEDVDDGSPAAKENPIFLWLCRGCGLCAWVRHVTNNCNQTSNRTLVCRLDRLN